jgi:hypothetical protein
MIRAAFLSTAVISLLGFAGCERTATTVPEEPAEKEWAPPEDAELEAEGEVDEEKAPFLSRRTQDDG